uniref:Uncharacterized protein n=1 Tax=Romanomermis culicivorax TaxID=13658 RepID=A0A915HUZ5_ROMCU
MRCEFLSIFLLSLANHRLARYQETLHLLQSKCPKRGGGAILVDGSKHRWTFSLLATLTEEISVLRVNAVCPVSENLSINCACSPTPPYLMSPTRAYFHYKSTNIESSTIASSLNNSFRLNNRISGTLSHSLSVSDRISDDHTINFDDDQTVMNPAILTVLILLSITLIASFLICIIYAAVTIKKKRKLEGKYRPAKEEEKSAVSNLPPLPPPAIEGLI